MPRAICMKETSIRNQFALAHPVRAVHWRLWSILLLIVVAEGATLALLQLGLALHALLLVGLTLYCAFGRHEAERRLALALTLVPLMRILSLSLPLALFPQIVWYLLVAAPLLAATMIAVRQLRLSRGDLGLRLGNVPIQLMLAEGGLALGAIEYAILAPPPLFTMNSTGALVTAALVLLVTTGFTEELIFRGLLQSLATPILREWGLIYVALLFAALHIGYRSVSDSVFVCGVGLLFAYVVYRSGSILGVTLAHGLTNVTLFLIMPYLAQQSSNPMFKNFSLIAWASAAMGLTAVFRLATHAKRRGAR